MTEVTARLSTALADRYRIEREIGAGGMATVYLARDVKHDREVALKVLRPELAAVLGAERFLQEIRISARLDHPHILTLIDSGEAEGFLYYVMPFVRGESLRARLEREKQLGVDESLAITRQVASALEYAHKNGVVHRDIKPENILIHEGEAILADFGIAVAVKQAGGNRLTETGLSLGTPQYMSPEQATGDRSLDARSDVYSLAAVLYEMLAGEPPHGGATVQAVIAKLMTERPTRLRVLRETVPEGVDNAVARALSKVPADRYADAGEFARALTLASGPQRSPGRLPRWIPAAAGVVVLALAGIAAFLATRGRATAPQVTMDRVQITTTGNVDVPSLSPDGTRIAFSERQCDPQGSCKSQLVIQDSDGTNRLVIARNIATLWSPVWTHDSRFLVFGGSGGDLAGWGIYVVSTLGGNVRRIGCCEADILGADTVVLSPATRPADTIVQALLVTLRDGRTQQTVPVFRPGLDYNVFPTGDPATLAVLSETGRDAYAVRLIDRNGRVLDGTESFNAPYAYARPVPGRKAALVALQRSAGAREYDIARVQFDGTRISGVDTVLNRFEMTTGWFDVSPDGERLTYRTGPIERTVWVFDRAQNAAPLNSRSLLTSTATVLARISPAGDMIALARHVPTSSGQRYQLFLLRVADGATHQLTAPLEDLADFEWSSDQSGLVFLNHVSRERSSVVEVDTSGTRVRELLELPRSGASGIQVLRDGRLVVADGETTTFHLYGGDGKRQATWRLPASMAVATRIAGSPDSRYVALMGWDRNFDSVTVASVDVSTGKFSLLFKHGAEGYGRITWIDDSSLLFDIHEGEGVRSLFRIPPGGRPERVGRLPYVGSFSANTSYTISRDGRRVAATVAVDKSDAYMIRNFGEVMRR